MKAIAVLPGKPNTVHLAEMPKPSVDDVANGRGVLVKVLRVLGNKVMVGTVNAGREHFEAGVRDLAQAEAEYPGWLSRLLTDPVRGLENYTELFQRLTSSKGSIKVFCEVAEL